MRPVGVKPLTCRETGHITHGCKLVLSFLGRYFFSGMIVKYHYGKEEEITDLKEIPKSSENCCLFDVDIHPW